jgi:predicted homoserine dehydrogenase-like protein
VAIANRTVSVARRAYDEAGREGAVEADTLTGLEDLIRTGIPAITSDFDLLCQSGQIDAILELTGSVEFGARACLAAIAGGKHFITMNAELDGTLGPLMRRRAEAAGVIYSVSDGDQPGVQMNLWRHVRAMGLTPLVCGNIKGLHDPYRTPETQKGFAEKWGQDPYMVTSFADGTKISFEQAIVANATGMCVARRGMGGRDFRGHVDELTTDYDIDELKALGGVVDYVVGARPGPGVFVLATHDDPKQKHLLNLYKLGEGPLYSFYTPITCAISRCPSRSRARSISATRCWPRPASGSRWCHRQDRPEGRANPRRVRRLPDLRAVRERAGVHAPKGCCRSGWRRAARWRAT